MEQWIHNHAHVAAPYDDISRDWFFHLTKSGDAVVKLLRIHVLISDAGAPVKVMDQMRAIQPGVVDSFSYPQHFVSRRSQDIAGRIKLSGT